MSLKVVEKMLPSGWCLGEFYLDKDKIGIAYKAEGGWRLIQGRKVLTQEEAARVLIDKQIQKARKEERRAMDLMIRLVSLASSSTP
jgi:hypothetical protein